MNVPDTTTPSGAVPESTPRDASVEARSHAYMYMDATRAVCAVGVALAHVWTLLIGDYVRTDDVLVNVLYFVAGFGHAGVVLFFVLSGYWISRSVVLRIDRAGWSWTEYLIDRLSRLLVVVVPVLLIGGSLDFISANVLESTTMHGQTGSFMLRVAHERSLSVITLLGNLAFLQGLAVPPFGSNGPLWSLAYEFWYYLWFPALWLLLRRRRFSLGLATLVLAFVYPDLALGFVTWGCGAFLFLVERNLSRVQAVKRWTERYLLAVAALPFFGALFWLRASGHWWLDGVLAFTFSALLLGLILRNPPPVPGLRQVARYGAQASFSLYATHFPIVVFAATLLVDRVRPQPALGSVLVAYALLLALIAFAWGFATLTEARTKRVRAFARKFVLDVRGRLGRRRAA